MNLAVWMNSSFTSRIFWKQVSINEADYSNSMKKITLDFVFKNV